MILDSLNSISRCRCIAPLFATALDFVSKTDLRDITVGKHEIQGSDIYAIAMKEQGRARIDCRLEAHKRYADIQILLAGTEEMGWKPVASCSTPTADYSPDKDVIFFNDQPDTWFSLSPSQFAIFFHEDAHMPMISTGQIHKVVLKIKLPSLS